MKIKIITTDPTLLKWKSLKNKITAIKGILNMAKNANFDIEIEYRDIVPEVKDGRITHKWFDDLVKPFYIKEVYFVGLHMGDKQRKDFGIQPSLRGLNQVDNDDMGDFYFWADEDTKRGRYNQFIETFIHEIRHEICRGIGVYDDTHTLHKKHGTLREQFHMFDMAKYRPLHQAKYALLRKALVSIINGLQRQLRPKYMLPVPYTLVTQPYGNYNPTLYKLTGHHIGVDLRAAKGTPVVAPCDGEVVESGYTKALGYYFVYKMYENWLVVPHLDRGVAKGTYNIGEKLAEISDTGLMTAPHFHGEVWTVPMDRGKLTKDNWHVLTTDPLVFFDVV